MPYENFVAGVLGGFTSTLLLHPLDLLKVRFAVSDGQSSLKRNYKNIFNAFPTIIKEEGYRGLYKGVGPNCLGSSTSWGLYFLFYNQAKERLTLLEPGLFKNMIAGACAGTLATLITNPIWVVKTRLCLQYGTATPIENKRYSGTWDALKKVYRYEGISGLYRGFVPGLLNVSHGAIQLGLYEEMKKRLYKSKELGTLEYLSCAALSKLLAAAVTYPYSVMRARLQDQHVNYKGLIDVVRRTWRNESIGGFYKGLGPSLIRVVPASAITFLVYEKGSSFLKRLSTG